MSIFDNMSLDQAMEYIGGKDIYMKWQEDPNADANEWFDLTASIVRARNFRHYLRELYTFDRQRNRRICHEIDEFYNIKVNEILLGDTDKEKYFFLPIGLAIYSSVHAQGWAMSFSGVAKFVNDFLSYVNCDYYTEVFDELVRDGEFCLYICDECGEYCNDRVETNNGNFVCPTCRQNHYSWCDYGHYWFPSCDAVEATGPNGEDWTINCEGDTFAFTWDEDRERYIHDDYEDEDASVIRGYHAHSDDFVLVNSPWSKSNNRHFGVELEVECVRGSRNESAKAIDDWFDSNRSRNEQLLFEEDGSIDHGFEMISNPMGLDKHREIWKWLEQPNLIANIRSHNTSTCGLHVHVSRKGLSSLTISKAVCFVNNPSNKALIKTIARRYGSGYCRAKHVTLADGAKPNDKYEMVNLCKRHTLEFRIFRGTLNYNAIQAAIEFTNAVINFAANTSLEELSELKFFEFIYKPEQRMDTKFLRTYLEQRSSRIKDIVDKQIKPMYNLRVVKPEPVAVVADEPPRTPEPRQRGSSRRNISYSLDELVLTNEEREATINAVQRWFVEENSRTVATIAA